MASIGTDQRFGAALAGLGRMLTGAVLAALVVAVAGPALALDATGTWSGKGTCWQARARATRTEQRDTTMLISQKAEALFVEIDGTSYRGNSYDSNRKGTRARGSAARYPEGGAAYADSSPVLTLRINVDDARGRSRITVKSTAQNGRRCKYRFSRVSDQDPGLDLPPSAEVCGDGVVNNAPNEECDGAATGTPCDGACTADCTCPTTCEPLDVSGHWEGVWVSAATDESGQVVADLRQDGEFVFGAISFPPFGDANFSPPFLQMSACPPSEFSTGAILPSGIVGTLEGIATNTSMNGTWGMLDGSDYGTWHLVR